MIKNENRPDQARSWTSDWGNLVAVGVAIFVAIYLIWLIFEWGSDRTFLLVQEFAFLPVMLIGVLFVARMVFFAPVDQATRRAWALIGIGFLFWLAGDSIWAYYEIFHGEIPYPSSADYAYLLGVPAIFLGILTFPAAVKLSRSGLIRFWLDTGIILVGLSAMITYLILGPDLLDMGSPTIETFLFIAYPFTDVLMVLAVFGIMVRRPLVGSVSTLGMLAAGLLVVAASDLLWTYMESREIYVAGGVTYALWMIGQSLLVVTPQRHFDVLNRRIERSSPGNVADFIRDYVPYAAAVVAMAVLVVTGIPRLVEELGMTVVFLLVLAMLIVARQIFTLHENARFRLTQVVRESEERFQALVEHSTDVITVLDEDFQCLYQSPSSREIIGHDPVEIEGSYFLEWVHEDDRDLIRQTLLDVTRGSLGARKMEWQIVGVNGAEVHLETFVSNELANPSVRGLVLNSRDVTDRRKLESELTFQAYHDALTSLPNRAMFLNNLVRTTAGASEHRGVGLMFIDLDRFKLINDTLGHDAGDELLVLIGERLRQTLRPGDSLGRLAGDEFTILLNGLRTANDAKRIAERVHDQLQEPLTVAGHEIQISTSIGVSFTDTTDVTPEDLLKQADSAMYAAKRNGRGRVELFEPWMTEQLTYLPRDRTTLNPADS